MKRREAIKNISLSFGATIATPLLMQVLNSCTENKPKHYLLLNKTQEVLIRNLSDLIFPQDLYPKIKEMNLISFVDQILFYTITEEEKKKFILGTSAIEKAFTSLIRKDVLIADDIELKKQFLQYLNAPKTKHEKILNTIKNDFLLTDINDSKLKSEYLIYHFIYKSRYYLLLGYCTSEVFIKSKR